MHDKSNQMMTKLIIQETIGDKTQVGLSKVFLWDLSNVDLNGKDTTHSLVLFTILFSLTVVRSSSRRFF